MRNEEISLRTKKALAEALKKAMKSKKFSAITISEIVEACEVNRKTFYYHFQDIYGLLKWVIEQEAIEVVKNFDFIADTEKALRFIMDYVDKNDYIVNSVIDSMGYKELREFLYQDLFSVIYEVVEQGEREIGVSTDPQFKRFMTEFYTDASVGMIVEWARNRMNQDKKTVLRNLLFIYKVSISSLLSGKVDEKNY